MKQDSELKKIWEKWKYLDIPLRLENECIEVAKPFAELMFAFLEMNIRENIVDEKDARDVGEQVGGIMAQVCKTSLLLGYEYANNNPRIEYNDNNVMNLMRQAYPLIKQTSKSANNLILSLISGLVLSGEYKKYEGAKTAEEAANLLLTIQSRCFRLGFKYLKDSRHNKGVLKMQTFNVWPGEPPKRCGICRKKVKKTFVFGDTKKGHRNLVMCERCYKKIGSEKASYGESRRYAKIAGIWISGQKPDWHPDEIPDGTMIEINNQFSREKTQVEYKKSLLGR